MRAPTVAGLLVLVVAALTIGGVWLFGGNDADGATSDDSPTATTAVEGPQAQIALTSNMYAAPSRTSDLVAVVPEARTVRITGRTDDSTWIRVIYPVSSTLEGWIAEPNFVAESLPDLAEVPDVASVTQAGASGEGGLLDEPALPDLSVSSADVAGSGLLTVRITNLGRTSFDGAVTVRVTTAEGEIVASLDADLSASPLGPGRSAAVNTGFTVTQTGLFIVEVDPTNEVEESSEFNNAKRVLLVGTGGSEAPAATETPADGAGGESGGNG